MILDSSVFPHSSIRFCLMSFGALLLSAQMLRIIVSSWTPLLLCNAHLAINIAIPAFFCL